MSVIKRFIDAVENKDEATIKELVCDDYKFFIHIDNKVLFKSDLIGWCMSDSFTRSRSRIIYENDEIGVEHTFVTFANGTTPEAVLSVHRIVDGKIISTETGATALHEYG